jgi:lipopolysaccharide export LptBFGC system permease protein LptF
MGEVIFLIILAIVSFFLVGEIQNEIQKSAKKFIRDAVNGKDEEETKKKEVVKKYKAYY